jgi:hypothetical protein
MTLVPLNNARTLLTLIAVVGSMISLGCAATALARTRDITVIEARQLVIHALYPTQRALPKLDLSPFRTHNVSGFYKFEVTWAPPGPGSAVVGNFAVNRVTGDVWELVPCEKRVSADLGALQSVVRKRINLTADELRLLGKKAPCEP